MMTMGSPIAPDVLERTGLFRPVTERHDRIAVVGTGHSLKGVDIEFGPEVYIIAVNGAHRILKRFDAWFTLDLSRTNLEFMKKKTKKVQHFLAVPSDYGRMDARLARMRRKPDSYVHYLLRVSGEGHGRFKTRSRLPDDPRVIHTGNSGWGAFQLACHMQPEKVGLFGFDGFGGYAYGGKPIDLKPMRDLFSSAKDQVQERGIRVANGSVNSVIECFPRETPQDVVRWLEE